MKHDTAAWATARLGHTFADPALLRRALTHRSASGGWHNERLEFLGDALLNFLIAEALYRERESDDEGHLSRLRSTLVRGTTLAEIGAELDLGDHLILGGGELRSGGFRRGSTLADAVEALLGAVYLDGGIEAARECVARLFEQRLKDLPATGDLKDPKTQLQEWLQGRGRELPCYEVVDVSGREHAQQFRVSCTLADERLSFTGTGSSRRRAEQEAAREALDHLQGASA